MATIYHADSFSRNTTTDGGFYSAAGTYTVNQGSELLIGATNQTGYTLSRALSPAPAIVVNKVSCMFRADNLSPTDLSGGANYMGGLWYSIMRTGRFVLQVRFATGGGYAIQYRVMFDNTPSAHAALVQSNLLAKRIGVTYTYQMKIDHTNNKCEVMIDDELIIDHTIVNANALADTNNLIALMPSQATTPAYAAVGGTWQHWVVSDEFLGRTAVVTMTPTADAIPVDWTPNSGTQHFTRVNQTGTHDGDTTYIFTDVVNASDMFTSSNVIPTTIGTPVVHGIGVNLFGRKEIAGTRKYGTSVTYNGFTLVGSGIDPITTYRREQQFYSLDPQGNPWTKTSTEASSFGVKVTE